MNTSLFQSSIRIYIWTNAAHSASENINSAARALLRQIHHAHVYITYSKYITNSQQQNNINKNKDGHELFSVPGRRHVHVGKPLVDRSRDYVTHGWLQRSPYNVAQAPQNCDPAVVTWIHFTASEMNDIEAVIYKQKYKIWHRYKGRPVA